MIKNEISTEMIEKFVDTVLQRTGTNSMACIPVLQALQENFRYLPKEALIYTCEKSDITPAQITSVATFYSQFRHTPVGEHMISVCTGTACHVKGASLVYDSFRRFLNIPEDGDTDSDGLFTLQKVSCLGCCTLAPVVQIDSMTFGHLTSESVGEVIEEFRILNKNKDSKPGYESVLENNNGDEIRIGMGSCCVASGSEDVYNAIHRSLEESGCNVLVKRVGCIGMCHRVPLIEIHRENANSSLYSGVKPQDVPQIIRSNFKPKSFFKRAALAIDSALSYGYLSGRLIGESKYILDPQDTAVENFLDIQKPVATEHRGKLDPLNFEEYLSGGGFESLKKCVNELTSDAIIDEIENSGLRGRGGAGFSTGKKWRFVASTKDDKKYLVCNGDEGDPGAFMDRMLLESYPYRVIEGMLIAAWAVQATEGYFYIRAEYPLAIIRISEAISVCYEHGFLGEDILGTGFSFFLKIKEGAGAFVCGEETALLESISGRRGMPYIKPPFPAIKGLFGKPTLMNNVETFANIPWIIHHGADAFSAMGTEGSKGTKVFALAGKILRGGLIEVEQGLSIRDIVEKIGGGVPNGKKFKALQIGGPSGGCIPESESDLPVDYEHLIKAGAMIGSGGMIVLDEDDCMVDIARYFLSFTQSESCGKCTFCRVGTRRMLDIMEAICEGKGTMKDLDTLEELAHSVAEGSLCGLGKTAPNPILSTLRYFRDEYIAHINGICPSNRCKSLIRYEVDDTCIGCTICAQRCGVDAIISIPYQKHIIDDDKCIRCDACRIACPENSIVVKPIKDGHIQIKSVKEKA